MDWVQTKIFWNKKLIKQNKKLKHRNWVQTKMFWKKSLIISRLFLTSTPDPPLTPPPPQPITSSQPITHVNQKTSKNKAKKNIKKIGMAISRLTSYSVGTVITGYKINNRLVGKLQKI